MSHKAWPILGQGGVGGRTILFTKDWMGLLWEKFSDRRTKLSNGAVSLLKNSRSTKLISRHSVARYELVDLLFLEIVKMCRKFGIYVLSDIFER